MDSLGLDWRRKVEGWIGMMETKDEGLEILGLKIVAGFKFENCWLNCCFSRNWDGEDEENKIKFSANDMMTRIHKLTFFH